MSRKVVYHGPRNREVRVSEEILKKLGIKEGSTITSFQLDRIQEEILEAGRQSGFLKAVKPKP